MTIYNSNIWKFKNRNQLVTILNSISFDITLTLPASASSLFCFPDPETYKFSSALIIICFDRIFLFQFALDVFLSFTVHMMSSYTNSLTKHLMKPKKIVAGFFSMIIQAQLHLYQAYTRHDIILFPAYIDFEEVNCLTAKKQLLNPFNSTS